MYLRYHALYLELSKLKGMRNISEKLLIEKEEFS
jgi:hypothetical protein